MPSEVEMNMTSHFSNLLFETHSDRRRRKSLLLLECIDDGVDRIVDQSGGFLTREYEIRYN